MRQTWLQLISTGILIALAGCSTPPAPPQPTVAPSPPPPTPTPTDQELIGRPLNRGDAPVYRLMEDGQIRHLADWLTFISYGYLPQDVVTVSPGRLNRFALGAPLTRWVTGIEDRGLYLLHYGKRYLVNGRGELAETGGGPVDVSQVSDSVLSRYPLQPELLDYFKPTGQLPRPSSAAWHGGMLWVADEAGGLTRWNDEGQVEDAPGLAVDGGITRLDAVDDSLIMATGAGHVIQLRDGQSETVGEASGWGAALAVGQNTSPDGSATFWFTDAAFYDLAKSEYHAGQGLGSITGAGAAEVHAYGPTVEPGGDPSARITSLLAVEGRIWAGTDGGGLLRFQPQRNRWRRWTTLDSDLPDNTIHDLAPGQNGELWIATSSGVVRFEDNHFSQVLDGGPIFSLALAADGALWAAGDHLIAQIAPDGTARQFTPFEHPRFLDRFRAAVVDDRGRLWFVGDKWLIRVDGQTWTSVDRATGEQIDFDPASQEHALTVPTDFPDPGAGYPAWLQTWPRPAQDNGRCIHYLQLPSGEDFEAYQQIARMQRLKVRWVLVNYNEPGQLVELAPIFQQAGIMVVWRPHVRPDDPYTGQWARDVKFLRSLGLPPYIQVYNEPSLDQEWDGKPVDQATYLKNLIPAVREVYDAGGYVGLQQIEPEWLRADLQQLKAGGLEYTFDRLFFVPHPYGFNHPPDYVEDGDGVLGFREYAAVFQEEIGFTPPMIAGEGGWRPGEAQDARFPKIDETLHRDYSLAVFDWFREGKLSDGEPLPDYVFAYCPWLISDPVDPAAWFDSRSGDRLLTIQTVEAVPAYRRRFSWDQHP